MLRVSPVAHAISSLSKQSSILHVPTHRALSQGLQKWRAGICGVC
jgi:hypothetical protein